MINEGGRIFGRDDYYDFYFLDGEEMVIATFQNINDVRRTFRYINPTTGEEVSYFANPEVLL
jgi:hypothetical protein